MIARTCRSPVVQRIAGIITSPRATYAQLVERPQWLGVVISVAAAMAAASGAFLSTDVGRQALLDSQIQTLELFGRETTAVEYRQFERIGRHAVAYGAAGQVIGLLVTVFGVTLVAATVGRMITRARGTFRQVLAVVSHSSVILGLRAVCSAPLKYASESISSPTHLGVILPIFDNGTFGAGVLSGLDLFSAWWLVSLSIGLGVVFNWRAGRVTLWLLGAYGVFALTLAGIWTGLSGV
jgi:hypothetical protein